MPILVLLAGVAAGLALCLAAARTIRNPLLRAAVVAVAFFAPWYAFLPALRRLYPATDPSCSFLCVSDGELYGFVLGVGWWAGIVAGAVVAAVWQLGRRAAVAPGPPVRDLVVSELPADAVERVGTVLPLTRRQTMQTYLVAWDGTEPVGHVHIKWKRTQLAGVPDLEDVVALQPGVEAALLACATELARARGYERVEIESK